jgi:hypothetical protein
LNSLGVLADEQKDVYIDGRERQDVIDYRTDIFLPEMEKLCDFAAFRKDYDV